MTWLWSSRMLTVKELGKMLTVRAWKNIRINIRLIHGDEVQP